MNTSHPTGQEVNKHKTQHLICNTIPNTNGTHHSLIKNLCLPLHKPMRWDFLPGAKWMGCMAQWDTGVHISCLQSLCALCLPSSIWLITRKVENYVLPFSSHKEQLYVFLQDTGKEEGRIGEESPWEKGRGDKADAFTPSPWEAVARARMLFKISSSANSFAILKEG